MRPALHCQSSPSRFDLQMLLGPSQHLVKRPVRQRAEERMPVQLGAAKAWGADTAEKASEGAEGAQRCRLLGEQGLQLRLQLLRHCHRLALQGFALLA